MEVLDSVWQFLTTENEFNTKLIYLPIGCFFEIFVSFFIISAVLKTPYTKFQRNIYILLNTSISIISGFFVPSPFNSVCNYIFMFVLIKLIFKENAIKSIIGTILPTIMFALTNMLLLNPFLDVFHLNVDQIQYIPLYRLIYIFIIYTLIFIILLFIRYKKFSINQKEHFDDKNRKIIFTNMILGFFTLCVQLTITTFYTDMLPSYITFLSFMSLLAYFIINFYSLIKTMKLQITTKNLETAENYNTALTILYDNVKAFKHDFDNIIYTIGGYIDNNDIDGLKKYYKDLEKDCIRVNNISLLNPNIINNSGIYNLLMAKYKMANDNNVEISLEFFFDLSKLKMPIYEFSRMLGILLDNAIEAASVANKKQVNLSFRDSTNNHTQIINIDNTYVNSNLDKTQIFKKGVSSKLNHTGMGLWEVNQIINRNNNVTLITENDENYFKQHIEIHY